MSSVDRLSHLPNECLVLIAAHLDVPDLYSLAIVSKKMHSIAHDRSVWRLFAARLRIPLPKRVSFEVSCQRIGLARENHLFAFVLRAIGYTAFRNIPILQNHEGATHVALHEMTAPMMRGIDSMHRAFIAIRCIERSRDEEHQSVTMIFQSTLKKDPQLHAIVWTKKCFSSLSSAYPVQEIVADRIKRLLQHAPVGKLITVQQEGARTLIDGRSVVELF